MVELHMQADVLTFLDHSQIGQYYTGITLVHGGHFLSYFPRLRTG